VTGNPADNLRDRVRAAARNRCGYCRCSQGYVYGWLEIEHIVPMAAGGSDDEENLWLACRLCNGFKGVQTDHVDPETERRVSLFNPRRQKWSDHFLWSADGTRILGRTPCGRATIVALQLNNSISATVRERWVAAGWHPPADVS
jgi:hypothetical protein